MAWDGYLRSLILMKWKGFLFINAVLLRIFPYKVNDSTKCIKSREKKKQNDRKNFEIPNTGELLK